MNERQHRLMGGPVWTMRLAGTIPAVLIVAFGSVAAFACDDSKSTSTSSSSSASTGYGHATGSFAYSNSDDDNNGNMWALVKPTGDHSRETFGPTDTRASRTAPPTTTMATCGRS
jgi:hypothetical protein